MVLFKFWGPTSFPIFSYLFTYVPISAYVFISRSPRRDISRAANVTNVQHSNAEARTEEMPARQNERNTNAEDLFF